MPRTSKTAKPFNLATFVEQIKGKNFAELTEIELDVQNALDAERRNQVEAEAKLRKSASSRANGTPEPRVVVS